MPQQGYSIGRDVTLAVILPDGTALRLNKVTGFTAKQDTSEQKITPLDGTSDHLRFYQGWSGSFKLERRGPELDNYFALLEANYHAGLDEPPASIQQTIVEPNGAVSQFRFERVLLKFDDPGDWSADKSVNQGVSFMAARRIKQG
jgi:hypothetical protein